MEGAKHRRPMVLDVLDQLHLRCEAESLEQRQRRRTQQLREPGMEGADLDRPPAASTRP